MMVQIFLPIVEYLQLAVKILTHFGEDPGGGRGAGIGNPTRKVMTSLPEFFSNVSWAHRGALVAYTVSISQAEKLYILSPRACQMGK